MRILMLTGLLVLSFASAAQIYKSTDAEGNVTYSDTPPVNTPSEKVEIRETNSTPPPPDIDYVDVSADDSAQSEEEDTESYTVGITAPVNETTIPMGPGNFSVAASVEPALAQGALLQLYVDGAASGIPQLTNNWDLTNVFRGAHDLTVAVVNSDGTKLAESEPVRVYVLRPSVNFKNRN
ncbi:MAG: DUF4124 domain-containing protein [Pseudomonadota bacterium]